MHNLLLALVLLPSLAFPQDLHRFSNGEITDAEKINENFNSLKSAINTGVENTQEDGAVYGSPVWIDSNGTLISGRDGNFILWRINGQIEVVGQIRPDSRAYNDSFTKFYASDNCEGTVVGRSGVHTFWAEGGTWRRLSAVEAQVSYKTYLAAGMPIDECEGGEDNTEGMYQSQDTGIDAPTWDTDGTQFFKDIR